MITSLDITTKPKPYRSIKKYEQNPYHEQVPPFKLIETKKNVDKKESETFIGKTSGEEGKLVFYTKHHKDNHAFVKIFREGLHNIFNLSKKSQKILQYILLNLKPNTDLVVINIESEEVKKKIGYNSKATLYRGLAELITRKIIAKTTISHNHFFINPAYIFNGKREIVIVQHFTEKGDTILPEELDEGRAYTAENTGSTLQRLAP